MRISDSESRARKIVGVFRSSRAKISQGVNFNLPTVYQPAMSALFDMGASARSPVPREAPLKDPEVGFRQGYANAHEALTGKAAEKRFAVETERLFLFSRASGTYVLVARSSTDWNRHGSPRHARERARPRSGRPAVSVRLASKKARIFPATVPKPPQRQVAHLQSLVT